MTVFDKMKIEFLRGLKAAGDEVQHFRVHELAAKYGVKESYVREKLVEWHTDKLIRLSAFHESGAVRPLEEWADSEYFFNHVSDSNYKRVRLLARGAEFLEQLPADEPETPKHAIGFHG
jgi:hypothetical protein